MNCGFIQVQELRFFGKLLGWQRKPRVWPGQAAPQRSIFALLDEEGDHVGFTAVDPINSLLHIGQ